MLSKGVSKASSAASISCPSASFTPKPIFVRGPRELSSGLLKEKIIVFLGIGDGWTRGVLSVSPAVKQEGLDSRDKYPAPAIQ